MPLIRRKYKAYPGLIHALEMRHESYNETLDFLTKQARSGDLLVIQPKKPVEIGRMERSVAKITALYEDGYTDGMEAGAEVKTLLGHSGAEFAPETEC